MRRMKNLCKDDNTIQQDDVMFHCYMHRSFDFIECGSIKSDVVFSENDIYEAVLPVIPQQLNNLYSDSNQ